MRTALPTVVSKESRRRYSTMGRFRTRLLSYQEREAGLQPASVKGGRGAGRSLTTVTRCTPLNLGFYIIKNTRYFISKTRGLNGIPDTQNNEAEDQGILC